MVPATPLGILPPRAALWSGKTVSANVQGLSSGGVKVAHCPRAGQSLDSTLTRHGQHMGFFLLAVR